MKSLGHWDGQLLANTWTHSVCGFALLYKCNGLLLVFRHGYGMIGFCVIDFKYEIHNAMLFLDRSDLSNSVLQLTFREVS